MNHTEVLIVGAGPTGLLMGIEMARRGVPFRLIEKNAGPSERSKALGIQARTLEIFEQMGIVQPFVEQGQPGVTLRLFAGGQARGQMALGAIGEAYSAYPYILFLEQSRTERILLQQLARLGGTVHNNTTLTALTQDADGVTCTLQDAQGNTETIQAQYVVGADGARSTVRHLLNVPFAGDTYEGAFMLADTHVRGPVQYDAVSVFLDATGLLAFFPLPGENRLRVIGLVPTQFANQPDVTFDQIAPLVVAQTGLPIEFYDTEWFAIYKLHHRVAEQFQQGRLFLAGDAAHVHSPVGAQGMNTGLQDAYNLAWKLAAVLQQQADPALLDTYAVERRPIATTLVNTTDRAFRIAAGHNRFARFARRNIVPRIVPRLMRWRFFQQTVFQIVSQTRINYRQSPLARQDGNFAHGAIQPGDRVPYCFVTDPASGKRVALHELLRDLRLHLLIFDRDGRAPQPTTVTTALGAALGVHLIGYSAENRDLFAAFGVQTNAFILVRPDGYVAYRNQPANREQLQAYINRWWLNP